MNDKGKTKEQLKNEMAELRQEISELKKMDVEHKKVKGSLSESEERYRAFFEQAADSIVLIDVKTGKLVEFNEKAHENLGYTHEEFQKLKIPDFEIIESVKEVKKHFKRIIEEGFDLFETKHRTKDGQIRDILVSAKSISVGGREFIQGIWRDVTEPKKNVEELKRKQALNELLLNALPHPAMLINKKRIVQAANKIAINIGVKLGEYCWKEFGKCEYLSDEDKKRAEENPDDERIKCTFCLADEAMKGPELKKMNNPELHAFNRIWDTYWVPIDKEIFLHYAIDITENKNAQEALRESEARYKDLYDNAPDMFASVDPIDAKVLDCNRTLTAKLGYSKKEIVGRSIFDIYHPDYMEEVKKTFQTFIKTGEVHNAELILKRKDGSKVDVILNASAVHDEQGNVLRSRSVLHDITDLKRIEDQLNRINRLKESLLVSGSLDQKLKLITDGVVKIFNADFARIWIIRPGDLCDSGCFHARVEEATTVSCSRKHCLQLMASSGRYTHIDGEMHGRVPYGFYKIGRIAANESPKFVTNDVRNDLNIHDRAWAGKLGLVSFAGYRLLSEEMEPVGVLALFLKYAISPDEDALLEGIANTTAQVIQTAKAEDALQRAHDELEDKVNERTVDLESAVELLKDEIDGRIRIEQALVEAEKMLRFRADELEENNVALKVLLKQRGKDKVEFENNILSNIKHLIMPYMEKLKRNRDLSDEVADITIMESNLKEIISPFSAKLSFQYYNFTPKEIMVADLIKDGKQDKEITEVLNISLDTIKTHRRNIRKKLGINNKKINLRTKLLSLSQ